MRRWSEPLDREEFLGIPDLARDIEKKEERLEHLRTKAEGDGALQLRDRVQTSPGSYSQVVIDLMVELSKELDELRADLKSLRRKAEKLIDKLDGEEAKIMRLYYLHGLTWLEIAELMAYDRATIFRRRDAAMERLFGAP